MKTYIEANIGALKALQGVIAQVDDIAYQAVSKPAFQSSLGQHARHILEHYQCFISQVGSGNELNYDLRCRNLKLESERSYCLSVIDEIIEQLQAIHWLDKDISHADDYSQSAAKSSLCRELMFLVSHTQHHNAMIAAMQRLSGNSVDESFGVANATLNHLDRLKSAVSKAVNES